MGILRRVTALYKPPRETRGVDEAIKNMLRKVAAFIAVLAAVAGGTYRGSVVSSFNGFVHQGSADWAPLGVAYGAGYVWVIYYPGLVTKRVPASGSIISTVYLSTGAGSGESLAWEAARAYLYACCRGSGASYWNAASGELAGSFPLPAGAARLNGIDYNNRGSPPIWACQWGYLPPEINSVIWNMTAGGSVVSSWNVNYWPVEPRCLAYDGDTAGGPFLFVGMYSAPSVIGVVNPANCSLVSTFRAPTYDNSLADLAWDGTYLWAVDNGPGASGWIYRFVAHEYPAVTPASWGRIKAAFR